ncbi:hypothetical protein KQX54_006535 [Cotesia glomerata]|uniref:Uncharacterized protein n=1 Tax=Cotesia glomerata TaxID=32391 RepID=A0AAV7J7Y1_COTGL|nr:hypothetical protein KQX54_006535 [Cotesia glomerata]
MTDERKREASRIRWWGKHGHPLSVLRGFPGSGSPRPGTAEPGPTLPTKTKCDTDTSVIDTPSTVEWVLMQEQGMKKICREAGLPPVNRTLNAAVLLRRSFCILALGLIGQAMGYVGSKTHSYQVG